MTDLSSTDFMILKRFKERVLKHGGSAELRADKVKAQAFVDAGREDASILEWRYGQATALSMIRDAARLADDELAKAKEQPQ